MQNSAIYSLIVSDIYAMEK